MESFLKNTNEYKIEKTPVYEMGANGNVLNQGNFKLHLSTNNGVQLTRDYWNMIELGNDYFVVCDVNVASDKGLADINEYSMSEFDYSHTKFAFKFGVVRLQRNNQGQIIPLAEKIIVPIIYDRISENNQETLTAYNNGKLTYIELNPGSANYGKQIVPAILDHAVPFSIDYGGFAECGIDGTIGYLPRNCMPREKIESSDLLTEEEVRCILQGNDSLHDNSINKLSALTGQTRVLRRCRDK